MTCLPNRTLQSHFSSADTSAEESLLKDCKVYFDSAIKRFGRLGVSELFIGENFHPEQVYGQLTLYRSEWFSAPPKLDLRLKTKKMQSNNKKKFIEGEIEQDPPLKSILKNKEAVNDEIFDKKEMELFMNEMPNEDMDGIYEQSDSDDEKEARFEDFFTPHQAEESRVSKRVAQIEHEMLEGEKPWHMKGEIEAKDRPADSVLEQYLEFDRQTKVPVAITAELTGKIESVIRRRVKDRVFDDVERKVKPETDYRPPVKLDFEKSKKGLADLYVDFYSKAIGGGDKEVDPEEKKRTEIKDDMRMLFEKLNTLSHSAFMPLPTRQEIKIVPNLPTIATEEVGQVVAGDSLKEKTMLAPEEIASRIKHLETRDDMDDEEKRRLRRKRKEAAKKRKAKGANVKATEKSKRNFDEEMALKKAERLLHKTPNMRIAERELAKPKKRKLLA